MTKLSRLVLAPLGAFGSSGSDSRNEITPLLEQMTTGYGLSRYTVEKIATQAKATIVAKITLYPVYAVENFDIYVSIRDEDVTVE